MLHVRQLGSGTYRRNGHRVRRVDLDLISRVLLGLSLSIFAAMWFAVMSGRYRSRRPMEATAFDRAARIYMFGIGLMLVSILMGLFLGDGPGYMGVILSGFALLGWSQERLARQAQSAR